MFFVYHALTACAWGHSSNKYCVTVFGSILIPFYRFFFRMDCSVRCTRCFSFMSPGGDTIFAKLPSKITKSPIIGGKVFAHHFVQIAQRFEENSTTVV